MTLTNQTNSLCSLLEEIDIKDCFEYVYLDSNCFEVAGQTYTTKHYPLDDFIRFDATPYELRTELLENKLKLVHSSQVMYLRSSMLEYIKENPNRRGTIYFSPANTLATINTQAKSIYMFGVGSLESDSMEIHSESNYLII